LLWQTPLNKRNLRQTPLKKRNRAFA